jgi:hypothetical protein
MLKYRQTQQVRRLPPDSASQTLNDLLCAKTSEMVQGVLEQREEILKAFIAETGLMPSECEQITQGNKWWIQKRT